MKEKFLKAFADALERSQPVNPEDEFRSLAEWDSLSHMSLIAMLDMEFGLQIEGKDFERMRTVGDVLAYVESTINSR